MTIRECMARAIRAAIAKDNSVQEERNNPWIIATPSDESQVAYINLLACADAALDCLTAPPSEAMIAAGLAMLRGGDKGPATGTVSRAHDPIGWYRHMVLRIWECMVRTMIEEGK